MLLRTDLAGLCSALDLLTVLIHTCDKQHLLAFKALKAGECVTGNRRVSAAEVRLGIDVIERGCEAVGHRFGALLWPLALGQDLNDPLCVPLSLLIRPQAAGKRELRVFCLCAPSWQR